MSKKPGKRIRSRGRKPPPKCKALLLCDKTIVEAITGKTSIIGVFDRFNVLEFPGRTAPFTVFLQLTDGIGRYDVVIEVHDLQNDQVLGRGSGIGLTWPEKLLKMNLMLPVPPVPITHAGVYDLVVFANGQEIDRQKFEVRSLEPTEPADEHQDN